MPFITHQYLPVRNFHNSGFHSVYTAPGLRQRSAELTPKPGGAHPLKGV